MASTTDLQEATPIPDSTFPINVFHLAHQERLIAVHWHDHLEWIYVHAGMSRIQIDDLFIVAEPGDVIFINSHQIHGAISLSPGAQLFAIVLNQAVLLNAGLDSTDPQYFRPIIDRRMNIPTVFRRGEGITEELANPLLAIESEFREQLPAFELLIKANLFRVFALAIRHFGCKDQLSLRETQNRFGDLFQFLREHYYAKMTLLQAAERVNLSSSQFCKKFKEITGRTFVEYLNLLRVEEAAKLLEQTDHPLSQIAERVGLTNNAYLSRVFTRHRGVSPYEYRHQFRSYSKE